MFPGIPIHINSSTVLTYSGPLSSYCKLSYEILHFKNVILFSYFTLN
jgi:hypothetical protein